MRGLRLGTILVEQGILSTNEVQKILRRQQLTGRPFGWLAEQMFGVSAADVEGAWASQYARLTRGAADDGAIEADADCVALVSRRQAWQFRCVPVAREAGEVVVLTDEKHLPRTLRFVSATFGEPAFIRVVDDGTLGELLNAHYPVSAAFASFANGR